MKWVKFLFYISATYGVLALTPLYFQEARIARQSLPALAYPEFFYGFLGVALAWQLVFFLVGVDPVRYRHIMLAGVVEKIGFGLPAMLLYQAGRIKTDMFIAGSIDLLLAVLFTLAWVKVGKERHS
jgi:hypothetical protein